MRTATLHVLRLDEPVRARSVLRPPVPDGCARLLVGTDVRFRPEGDFTADPVLVRVFGLWDDEAARDDFVDRVDADQERAARTGGGAGPGDARGAGRARGR